jgi:hypothetical protein
MRLMFPFVREGRDTENSEMDSELTLLLISPFM